MKHHEHVSRNLSRVTARAGANENGSDDGQKYDDWGMPAATGERREGKKHGGPVGSTVSHERGAKKRLDRHMRGHKPGGNRDHKAEGGPTDSGAVNQLMTDAADKALTGYAKGGAVKKGKGTNITIMVGSPGGAPSAPAVPPPPIGVPPGPPPPPPMPPPGPPMGGPPGMPPGGGAPPGLSPQLAAALAARGGMGRAKGGRVGKFDAGAGSGEGRLEKIEWEKDYLKKGKK